MTTLVTGFDPFGGRRINTSELVVQSLAAGAPRGLVGELLPTSYRRAEARIGELLQMHAPRTVLLLGLAAKERAIRLEQIALNLDDSASADNDGEVRLRRGIVEGAPVGYRSTLPLEAMARDAARLGEEVVFSHDAGGFVCNHVFFIAMHRLKTQRRGDTRCGFVHLPPVEVSNPRLEELVDVVRSWIVGWTEEERLPKAGFER